jgi:hypothetical protein
MIAHGGKKVIFSIKYSILNKCQSFPPQLWVKPYCPTQVLILFSGIAYSDESSMFTVIKIFIEIHFISVAFVMSFIEKYNAKITGIH